MQTSSQATCESAAPAQPAHPIAFSIHLSRNVVVQATGMGMVILMGLSVLPWPSVLVWSVVALAAVTAENQLLRRIARTRNVSRAASAWAAVLRVLTTTIYAFAALVLISRGGPGERLFAFALMSASIVHVLMRYYRSPPILIASIAPYLIILGIVGFSLTAAALRDGHLLAALAPALTIAMFAVQIWSARAQLSGAWVELMAAREAAEARERAAEAANRAKSDFLANMSHELRTPLNGVLGMTQALTTDRLTRTQLERVNIIRRSSESLLSVLNDLLDLSKIEASSLDLEQAEFDLGDLVDGVVAACRPAVATKGLAFEVEIADGVDGRYLGDRARIRRVLQGLADNAVKFTEAGGVRLTVDRDGEAVIFRVIDTGIGIAEGDLAHLFEGFFQADASLTRRYGGTGIGLAICGELAALMGGTIEAASTVGQGSTFTVRLPIAVAAPIAEDDGEAAIDRATDLRVLAAEDNPTNQLVLKTLLGPAGIAPTLVNNGLEALEAWERQDWDIVLMDIQMPEMNGVDAARAIRSRELETGRPRTPIVAVTANAMTHQIVEYRAAGMDGVVPKPIDLSYLLETMDEALAQADFAAFEGGGPDVIEARA
jgi:signal transduction histidine kinase/ActR/RegA family two-component response regulator